MRIFRGLVLALVPPIVVIGIGLPATVSDPARAQPLPAMAVHPPTVLASGQPARINRSTPVLAEPSYAATKVTLWGLARPRAAVRLQKLVGARWRQVRTVRASRGGSFRTVLARPAVTRSYRAVVAGRGSVVRRIAGARVTGPVQSHPKPPSSPAPDACGARPRKADGTYYACTFVDNFGGVELDAAKWIGQSDPGNGGDLCATTSPENIRVGDGLLHLSAMSTTPITHCPARADGTRASYTVASVSTWHRFGQQYGRFEARVKVQPSTEPGLQEAFWLWPDTRFTSDQNWPSTGEIDIIETYSSFPDLGVPFLHYADDVLGPVSGLNTQWNCRAPRGEWHTYALDWTAVQLRISIDGTTCLVATAAAASYRKPFIINLSQYLGHGANAYDGRAVLPATMEVDYVKAWR